MRVPLSATIALVLPASNALSVPSRLTSTSSIIRGGGDEHHIITKRRQSFRLFTQKSEDNYDDVESILKKQKRKLTLEFFSIGIPAFFQLAAEPLAGLVDTAYLGRLGPEVLGGAGVA